MTQKQIAHDLNETNDGNVYKALDELQDEKKIKKESEGFENYYSLI
jgi:DNA-binding PadR family transcriptional regulator